jgi:hypothetical protein
MPGPAYAGPQGAGTGIDQNPVQNPNTRFRLADGEDNNRKCGNGIGNIGYCNDISFDVTITLE